MSNSVLSRVTFPKDFISFLYLCYGGFVLFLTAAMKPSTMSGMYLLLVSSYTELSGSMMDTRVRVVYDVGSGHTENSRPL